MGTDANVPNGAGATAPIYIFSEGEITIDAPAEKVWPHVLNYGTWQNFTTLRHVSGSPGQEGEVVALEKEDAGLNFPLYYGRTLKLEPGRKVIWKTYREPPAGFGIVEFRVQEGEGQTRFAWDLLYEYVVPYNDESELEQFRVQKSKDIELLTTTVFPRLKRLVEHGSIEPQEKAS